jgi:hypothetical protein
MIRRSDNAPVATHTNVDKTRIQEIGTTLARMETYLADPFTRVGNPRGLANQGQFTGSI